MEHTTPAGTERPRPADRPSGADEGHAHDFEIVLVAYRSRALLEQLLPGLPEDVPVAVVDNGRGVDGVAELCRGRSGTRYLLGPGRGFGSGANLAARTSRRDVLVFLNPDCSPAPEQIGRLCDELRADPELALVGLTTVLPDGTVELGVGGWEPTVRRALVHAVGLHKLFPRAGLWARPELGVPIELDWLGAACMAMPRRTFQALGGFDESYVVYNEDVELGRAIRAAGLRQKLLTDVVAPHLGGGSGQPRPQLLAMRGAMTTQYVVRHNRPAVAVGIRLALTAGYLPRYLLCRLRGRRVTAREHAAYLNGLWRGAPNTG